MADPLGVIVVGTGRAGGALALASRRAGHRLVGTLNRAPDGEYGPALAWDVPLPAADLVVVAVRDDGIGEVADGLAGCCGDVGAVVHVSGATSVDVLAPLRDECAIGAFHPLQTMPDAATGARALAGSWVAVTAGGSCAAMLDGFAHSLGMHPFPLPDDVRRTYHAGASAAANFVVEALAVADDLFAAAGVPPAAARPLVEKVVANVFDLGAGAALTGPVARGDVSTVRAQVAAARDCGVGDEFVRMVAALAIRTGQDPDRYG